MLDVKKQNIVSVIKDNPLLSSKELHDLVINEVGYSTLKRILKELISENLITSEGKGKASRYKIASNYELFFPIDEEDYFQKEIDERIIKETFDFELIHTTLKNVNVFTEKELNHLKVLQEQFKKNIQELTPQEYNKELERLAIDLSWKSSQIEGNTYSLLETERLLIDKETALGKGKDEAVMLLNHKEAIDFIVDNPDYINPLAVSKIEDIHSILIKELGVNRNIRIRRVGISGTNYKPLDNEFQIREALTEMCDLVNHKDCIFEKAFLSLVLLSYIQAFADGNKRTARIVSNALLIAYQYCPISFRTVDSIEYKKAMLIFYEQNNINAFKSIFISQYEFAVKTYF